MTTDIPTLVAQPCTDTPQTWKVWCRFCEDWHYHGAHKGHHQAHCIDTESPYLATGYNIELPGPLADPDVELETIKLDLGDFYSCWHWLSEHPFFFFAPSPSCSPKMAKYATHEPGFTESLSIMVMKVDPTTMRCEREAEHNTLTQVWLECGPWIPADDGDGARKFTGDPCHDIDLDVGADTFEKAIRKLAETVMTIHGTYPEYRHCSHCLQRLPAGPTDPEREWFCSAACRDHGVAELVTKPVPGNDSVVQMVPWEEVFDCEHWPSEQQ